MSERKELVLIADDDPTIRKVMRAALERDGFRVAVVGDGVGAVRAFIEEPPALVLLDVEMPAMDGFTACAKIRDLQAGKSVPIVMVTGREDIEAVNDAYKAGATDFLAKPINWPIFGHRVRYILRASADYQRLRKSEAKNEALLQAMPDTFVVLSADGETRAFEPGNLEHPLPMPDSGSGNIADYLPQSVVRQWLDSMQQVSASGQQVGIEFKLPREKTSGHVYYEGRFLPYVEDQTLILVSDITARKQADLRIHKLAYYDNLTGLPNREYFRQQLGTMIEHAREVDGEVAILYVDLDDFKRINDTLGHTFGDGVLTAISERLAGCLRSTQAGASRAEGGIGIARLGGDEFAAAIGDFDDEDVLTRIAERVRKQLRQPVRFGGHEFVITPSIGIAMYPNDGDNVEDLLKNADAAMYQAKEAGRNSVRFYSGTMTVQSLHRLELESELRRAVDEDGFELHYQPKLDLASGRLAGVEALLRWKREDGYVPPDKFIPLAEETGLIMPLSDWVLRTACRQAHDWQIRFDNAPRIAINVSSQQFFQSDLRKNVMQTLFETGTKPSLLQLELTESILMRDVRETIDTLEYLKNTGVTLAIDDFGTGYSSLSYLKRFPLDALKIDRSFVKDLDANNDDAAICAAIIAMAHQLSLVVIAEGVETAEQVEFLHSQGCDQVQGFLFAKPMPAKQLEEEFLQAATSSANADSA